MGLVHLPYSFNQASRMSEKHPNALILVMTECKYNDDQIHINKAQELITHTVSCTHFFKKKRLFHTASSAQTKDNTEGEIN